MESGEGETQTIIIQTDSLGQPLTTLGADTMVTPEVAAALQSLGRQQQVPLHFNA